MMEGSFLSKASSAMHVEKAKDTPGAHSQLLRNNGRDDCSPLHDYSSPHVTKQINCSTVPKTVIVSKQKSNIVLLPTTQDDGTSVSGEGSTPALSLAISPIISGSKTSSSLQQQSRKPKTRNSKVKRDVKNYMSPMYATTKAPTPSITAQTRSLFMTAGVPIEPPSQYSATSPYAQHKNPHEKHIVKSYNRFATKSSSPKRGTFSTY